jgi:hypothetical protein
MNKAVEAQRTAYRVEPGKGYKRAGTLPMPQNPLGMPSACEPPNGTAGGLHLLNPPVDRQAPQMPFTWHPVGKEWESFGRMGKRIAFTSAYLAAHGWTYGRPV